MVNKWIVPPGGWYYMQGDTRIEADSADALINLVYLHRRNNHLEIGKVEEEVLTQIGERNPTFNINMESPPTTLFEKFKMFAGSILRSYIDNGGQLVDQNTANIRAQTCLHCHWNQKSEGDCKTCGGWVENAAISMLRPLVIGNRNVENGNQLKSCGGCGCDLKMIVWFPSKALGNTEDTINAYPSFCWQKDLNT